MAVLEPYLIKGRHEVGCDEAGRGPLAGPVMAAAVLLPQGYSNALLNDSKQLSEHQRDSLRATIEQEADAWAVASIDAADIDKMNILRASMHAMCMAVRALMGYSDGAVVCGGRLLGKVSPEFLLIDGNRFYNETELPFQCIVKGDARLMPIAAASILAKTHRDELMVSLHAAYPYYGWNHNKGYPTPEHYKAIEEHGVSPYHRRSFTLYKQHSLFD